MRTATTLTTLALACAGLLACTPLSTRSTATATEGSDDAYLAGRNHHLARRYEEARAAYQAALQADPQHISARNGLATLHAEQREFAAAVAIWRELTAPLSLSSGPGKAYLFGNLGHAYLLSGDYDDALVALEKACLLDPLNPRAWELMGETLRKLGQDARAEQMLRQAATLRQHDLRADLAAIGDKTSVAAIGQAAQVQEAVKEQDDAWLDTELRMTAGGMFELRRGKAPTPAGLPAPAAPLAPVPAAPAIEGAVARLEIRNGNGVPGMARALARRLGEPGVRVTRLSNDKGFSVRRTRIEYEAAHRAAAERLAERLGSAQLQEVRDAAPADLRLVLGRDLGRRGVALRPPKVPAGVTGAAGAATAASTPRGAGQDQLNASGAPSCLACLLLISS
ncbi:LytR C-terminal domain-containing protein [Massilia sp. ST3]|uniref:LytR C-terminal domain-containing protein n=1 Tax=Massilia sp. ST3 TaxID=2824903 RepID=UPI001B811931|nr:LytR C-terminal domain-containing protein [Massilia sp. ST3]MBQ5948190.1 tetratricopeptide repeat protein [Massilia sp. ST3]